MGKREIKTPSVTEQVKAKEKKGVHPLKKPDIGQRSKGKKIDEKGVCTFVICYLSVIIHYIASHVIKRNKTLVYMMDSWYVYEVHIFCYCSII